MTQSQPTVNQKHFYTAYKALETLIYKMKKSGQDKRDAEIFMDLVQAHSHLKSLLAYMKGYKRIQLEHKFWD